jgi:predicted acetyltransferase
MSERMHDISTALATEETELDAFAPIVSWAFGDTSVRALDWLKRGGTGNVRIARQGGTVVGGLLEVPMGQWFGGESVRALGLAGVAVAPEARGTGAALKLVRETLRSARERGFALSTLYPSTFALYRKAGYELAGSHCRFTLQLRRLPRQRRAHPVQALGAEQQTEVERLYREVARYRAGYLDRGPYVWQRVQNPDREPARAFGVYDSKGLSGYVFVRVNAPKGMPMQLTLSDFVATSPESNESLLAFLADHSTTVEHASWSGGPADARVLGLPAGIVRVAIEDYWMLRVVDVRVALLGRGYPPVDAAVELWVDDEILTENTGSHALIVAQGRARLEARSGLPRARLSAGTLAALYSGFVSPWELSVAGRLEADPGALGALSALFSGPAPGLADYF